MAFFAGTGGFIFDRTSFMAIASPLPKRMLSPLCHFMVRCDSCGKEYRYEPTNVFRYDHDLQTDSRPILFLKKNSSDVIFAMSTTIGRIHSASR
jgi:hypothetical protein